VNYLKLETLEDLMKLDSAKLISVPGIGDVLSSKILAAIGKL
jgi:DNA repair protein RadC